MSTSPDELETTRDCRDASACEVVAVAEQLIALVEELDAALGKGQVPPGLAGRLAQLRQTAERLI